MLYFSSWTVFGDNIKGLNSKCMMTEVVFYNIFQITATALTDEWRIYTLIISGFSFKKYKRGIGVVCKNSGSCYLEYYIWDDWTACLQASFVL